MRSGALIATILGIILILLILWDAFETIVLPRRVARRLRITGIYYRVFGEIWFAIAERLRNARRREAYLSLFGPLSLILLLATWAAGLVLGFGLIHWEAGARAVPAEATANFWTALYFSGTTFFTLGLGDISPRTAMGRAATVVESGTGFVLLALVVGYLPVLYQAFSRREVQISMLDEWAGSPPTSGELLRRLGVWNNLGAVSSFLAEWEEWAADLLESHISYPILAGFRSQHGNQSWLAGLTTVLDTSALVISSIDGVPHHAAHLTFAMARHVAVDLCQVLNSPPEMPPQDRLPPAELARLRAALREAGVPMREDDAAAAALADLRAMYEPYVYSLADFLLLPLPAWLPAPGARDNWQKSRWV